MAVKEGGGGVKFYCSILVVLVYYLSNICPFKLVKGGGLRFIFYPHHFDIFGKFAHRKEEKGEVIRSGTFEHGVGGGVIHFANRRYQ